MIKNVKHDDGLEVVKEKLNEVINVLLWENPTATVEKVAKQHLASYDRQIAKTRDELKTTLVEVKTALDSISTANKSAEGCRKDVLNFIQKTEADISSYKTSINEQLETYKISTDKELETYKSSTDKEISQFKSNIEIISNSLQNKIKQFITFYAQVGLHVKELCDGKK